MPRTFEQLAIDGSLIELGKIPTEKKKHFDKYVYQLKSAKEKALNIEFSLVSQFKKSKDICDIATLIGEYRRLSKSLSDLAEYFDLSPAFFIKRNIEIVKLQKACYVILNSRALTDEDRYLYCNNEHHFKDYLKILLEFALDIVHRELRKNARMLGQINRNNAITGTAAPKEVLEHILQYTYNIKLPLNIKEAIPSYFFKPAPKIPEPIEIAAMREFRSRVSQQFYDTMIHQLKTYMRYRENRTIYFLKDKLFPQDLRRRRLQVSSLINYLEGGSEISIKHQLKLGMSERVGFFSNTIVEPNLCFSILCGNLLTKVSSLEEEFKNFEAIPDGRNACRIIDKRDNETVSYTKR